MPNIFNNLKDWIVPVDILTDWPDPVWGWKSDNCKPLPVQKIPGKQKACP